MVRGQRGYTTCPRSHSCSLNCSAPRYGSRPAGLCLRGERRCWISGQETQGRVGATPRWVSLCVQAGCGAQGASSRSSAVSREHTRTTPEPPAQWLCSLDPLEHVRLPGIPLCGLALVAALLKSIQKGRAECILENLGLFA